MASVLHVGVGPANATHFSPQEHMNTRELTPTLSGLFSELLDGPPPSGAFMLNQGDVGLLRSLDKLSAAAASTSTPDGGSIAAHADHLRFGLSLMNRWANGEPDPFTGANWGESWRISSVDDAQWKEIRSALRNEAHAWLAAIGHPRDVEAIEINGIVGSIAHLAYHLGAIRQIDRAARGPKATEAPSGLSS